MIKEIRNVNERVDDLLYKYCYNDCDDFTVTLMAPRRWGKTTMIYDFISTSILTKPDRNIYFYGATNHSAKFMRDNLINRFNGFVDRTTPTHILFKNKVNICINSASCENLLCELRFIIPDDVVILDDVDCIKDKRVLFTVANKIVCNKIFVSSLLDGYDNFDNIDFLDVMHRPYVDACIVNYKL